MTEDQAERIIETLESLDSSLLYLKLNLDSSNSRLTSINRQITIVGCVLALLLTQILIQPHVH